MPRYFFDTYDGDRFLPDEAGIDEAVTTNVIFLPRFTATVRAIPVPSNYIARTHCNCPAGLGWRGFRLLC
jgi:hypothetical protein